MEKRVGIEREEIGRDRKKKEREGKEKKKYKVQT